MCSIHWARITDEGRLQSSGCAGLAADAVFVCTQVIMEDAPSLFKSDVRMSRCLGTSSTTQMAWVVVQYGRSSCSSWAQLVRSSRMLIRLSRKGLFLSVWGRDYIDWKETDHRPNGGNCHERKTLTWREPTSFFDHVNFGCIRSECQANTHVDENYRNMFESKICAEATRKRLFSKKFGANISSWSFDMEGHAKKCVERYCELANKTIEQWIKVATTCIDEHQFKDE